MSFGTTPLSTTALGTNQFPVSAIYVPNTSGGNLTTLQGGPSSTDALGNASAPMAIYVADGSDTTLGTTTDLSSANTLIGLTKAIKANTASLIVSSLPGVAATGGAVPANAIYIGGNKSGNLTGLSLDGSGNLNVNIAAGAGGGTASTYGAAFPSTGTAIGASDGTNMQGLLVESSSNKNLRVGIYSGANEATVTGANALKVDGSAVTQPVSLASLPALATGSNLVGGVYVYDSAGTNKLAVDSSGRVSVLGITNALPAGGNTIGAVTQASGPWTNNVTQFGGTNISTGTGASGTGIPRVTVSNDSQIELWDGTNGPANIKAARTAPVLADLAQVVALSPNNAGLPVNLPTITQKRASASTGSVGSLALAFSSNNVQGNSIVVVCGVGNGTAPTVSDSAGNTYQTGPQVANGSAFNVAIFYSVGSPSGGIAAGANTITVTNGGTTASIAMEIYEVSGLITQVEPQAAGSLTSTGTSATASTSSLSPGTPNRIAIAGVGIGTAAQTITAGSGWTNDSGQQNPTTPAGLFSFVSMSQFLGNLSAVTPQATFTSEPWAIVVTTFTTVRLGIEGSVKLTDGTVGMTFGQNTMANSVPVAIASNQSNLPVNTVQIAGASVSTAASGTQLVGVADGAGNAITSNSTTYTAKKALDGNILGTLGTAFTTAGKVDVKASSGDIATGAIVDLPAKGQAAMAASVPVTMANNQTAMPIGSVAGTAYAADQSNTQQQVSLYVKKTVAGDTVLLLGSATGANSLPVVIASDQGSVPIKYASGNATILTSAARTTTQTSADQTNNAGRGVRVTLNVTNAGTGSITLTINAKDTVSSVYTLLLSGAAVTSNSTNVYVIYPGIPVVANSTASDVLPSTWQVVVTANNANSVTYSVGLCYLI